MEPVFFATPEELRAWFAAHAATASELLVGFHKVGSGVPSITWPQAVDEALCVGWIDGVRRRLDDRRYTIRFTPRRRGSTWSAVNVARAEALIAAGRMQPAGLAAFEARDPAKVEAYSYEDFTRPLGAEEEARLRAHPAAWAFYDAQPPSYRRTMSWWVMSAKRPETRERRLTALIEASERGERLR